VSVLLPPRFSPECPLNGFVFNESMAGPANRVSVEWSPDGQFMYNSFKLDRAVIMYTGGDNWSIGSRTTPTNYRYQFINEIGSGGNCWSGLVTTAPDLTAGGQLLLALSSGTGVSKVAQYTLPFPQEIRQGNHSGSPFGPPYYPGYEPVLVGQFDVTPDNGAQGINDMQMSPDGTRFMASTSNVDGSVSLNQWNLTTPYDVLGTMDYQPRVDIVGWGFLALHVTPCGKCLYLGRSSGGVSEVGLFKMTTPWELSSLTTTPSDTLDVSAQHSSTIASIFATENDLYVLGSNTGSLYRYSR
jgi:hypothetical protein